MYLGSGCPAPESAARTTVRKQKINSGWSWKAAVWRKSQLRYVQQPVIKCHMSYGLFLKRKKRGNDGKRNLGVSDFIISPVGSLQLTKNTCFYPLRCVQLHFLFPCTQVSFSHAAPKRIKRFAVTLRIYVRSRPTLWFTEIRKNGYFWRWSEDDPTRVYLWEKWINK